MTTNDIAKIRKPQTRLKRTQICPPIAQKRREQPYVEVSELISTFTAYFSIYISSKYVFPYKVVNRIPSLGCLWFSVCLLQQRGKNEDNLFGCSMPVRCNYERNIYYLFLLLPFSSTKIKVTMTTDDKKMKQKALKRYPKISTRPEGYG